MRRPLQGVGNIVRFNWPFYLLVVILLLAIMVLGTLTHGYIKLVMIAVGACILLPMAISLFVSLYVYDLSGLYDLRWLKHASIKSDGHFANIHAGFDETTLLLRERCTSASITIYDFYDPRLHTEASIRRARAAYPALPETIHITTSYIPAGDKSLDAIFLIFAAHEIRDIEECKHFLDECRRVLRPDGRVIVTEHLRDTANFVAYTIGAFHFFPLESWLSVFHRAGLRIERQFRINPFVTTFILIPDGTAL